MFIALLAIGMAYLIGSFCSAIVISHLFNLPDPRAEGSKNPGATNVLRLSGKKYALLVLLLDALKGTLPVILAYALHFSSTLVAWIGFAAVLGHMYPLYFRFQGGKGVATTLGVTLGFSPLLGILTAMTWGLMAKITKISSLSALIAALLIPVYLLFLPYEKTTLIPFTLMSLMICYQHQENIKRLLAGTEPRIGK